MTEKRKGILFIISAAFFFSGMTVCVRLSGDLPTAQKIIFRNLVAAIWGFFLFGQVPDIYSVIGYIIIIGVAIFRVL